MVDAPLLFTDDDIICTKDPGYLFTDPDLPRGTAAFHSWDPNSKYKAGNKKHEAQLRMWAHAFEIEPLSADRWNYWRTDAGLWYLPKVDKKKYEVQLKKFFLLALGLHDQLIDRDRRFLDQRFLTMWLFTHASTPLKHREDYRIQFHYAPPPKNVPNSTFIHYCVGTHKKEYEEWFREKLHERTGQRNELLAPSPA
jgi:hypothetical protein